VAFRIFGGTKTGAYGKNAIWTVFPFATQPFVHGKWESSEVSTGRPAFRLRGSLNSTPYSVVDNVGKSGILPSRMFPS
jgi:hypothetical protein